MRVHQFGFGFIACLVTIVPFAGYWSWKEALLNVEPVAFDQEKIDHNGKAWLCVEGEL